jgi:hypothetical protein
MLKTVLRVSEKKKINFINSKIMRKVLLTVMMVSSLLAFNACKKDGETGPAGPAGPTGATGPAGAAGAAGAVGAAGAKGADGTKILSGTVDPVTADGAVGDFYFNKTTKTLWGPKVAAGWAGTSTGLTGPAGNQFLAGAGAPDATNPTNAKTGDYYFDTNTSIFYGPKAADGSWTGNVPLSSNASAKNYVFAKGFETVVESTTPRTLGQSVVNEYSEYTLNTSYKVTANDLIRIAKYPGWIHNREMRVQTVAGGPFDNVLDNADVLATPVGAVFIYTNMPTEQFTLTQDDKDRLTVNSGAAFAYLTYGSAQNVSLGTDLVIATKKNMKIINDATRFATSYTATTKFDLNAMPGLAASAVEDIKRDGKLYVKYRYFTPKTATGGNTLAPSAMSNYNAGWSDITKWAYAYVGTAGNTNGTTNLTAGVNPFGGGLGTDPAETFMSSASHFGGGGTAPFAPENTAVGTMDLATAGVTNRGKFTVNWTINSGTAAAATPHDHSDAYYNFTNGNLTYSAVGSTTKTAVPNTNLITYNDTKGGLEISGLTAIKLVQIQVLAIPAANVAAAKAKGVDINNPIALQNFVKL